jgi:pantetheine-phosphate adenylyltransferase
MNPPLAQTSRRQTVAVFPGQFDPITSGHLDIIRRGTALFDTVLVGVGNNPDKRELFSHDDRVDMIRELLAEIPSAQVRKYTGLTVDFVREVQATAILRGIRDVSDLRYEFQLALANRAVGQVETVFIMAGDQYAMTSSSLIRQVVTLGGDPRILGALVPDNVIRRLILWQQKHAKSTIPDAPAE